MVKETCSERADARPSGQSEPKSFEEAMKRLEEIVHKLEEGELSLEESLKIFEEGVNLSKFLTQKLTEAEAKVQKLTKTQEDTYKTEPLNVEENEQETF